MLVRELIGTCTFAPIAEAAVMSIGPIFFARVARAARRDKLTVGEYAAGAVRRFAETARRDDWRELSDICAGEDMPILCGLHHIVEMSLEDKSNGQIERHYFGSAVIGPSIAHCRTC